VRVITKELHHRAEILRRHAPFPLGKPSGRPDARQERPTSHAPSARGAANAHRIGVPLMHSLWHVRVHGAANVPVDGAVILAGNHTSFLDGPLIVGVSPRPVHFLVKQEVFVGPLGPILHGFGQIPVDRNRPDRAAVQAALATLNSGHVLGVFPEGTRTAGDFESVHNGLAYFALTSGAPVVPVACLGTAMNGKTVGSLPAPRALLDLVYGTPLTLEKLTQGTEGLGRRQTIAAVSERLRVRLAAHIQWSKHLTGRDT
jgi:1-acyl-sn-glycerol-3-phosphate acyltransferase